MALGHNAVCQCTECDAEKQRMPRGVGFAIQVNDTSPVVDTSPNRASKRKRTRARK